MAVAQTLTSHLRRYDVLIRYGGEEFLVVLPNTDDVRGIEVAEKLRNVVRDEVRIGDGVGEPLRISLGVATFDPERDDWDSLLSRAAAALYAAKNRGRDRVVWLPS